MKRLHQTDWEEGQAKGSFSTSCREMKGELNGIRNGGGDLRLNRHWTRMSTLEDEGLKSHAEEFRLYCLSSKESSGFLAVQWWKVFSGGRGLGEGALKKGNTEQQRKMIKQSYVESWGSGMGRWLPWKSMGVLLWDKEDKKVVLMWEWMKGCSFNQRKIILAAPGFHQCLKEENPTVCWYRPILFVWESSDHLRGRPEMSFISDLSSMYSEPSGFEQIIPVRWSI